MIGMKSLRVVIVVVIALESASCSAGSVPSGSGEVPTPPAPTSTTLATAAASAPAATPQPTPAPTPEVHFRALDTPADYSRSGAEAVDGTTAVGWVQIGKASEPEQPAVWDTTTGALRVLDVSRGVHPPERRHVRQARGRQRHDGCRNRDPRPRGQRGQDRAMAWNTETGDLRILDIPARLHAGRGPRHQWHDCRRPGMDRSRGDWPPGGVGHRVGRGADPHDACWL